jgi:Na+/H+ antiporter NhaD/arsenite permease-like protein
MTIVELIDLHKGFAVITHRIRTNDFGKLLWIIGLVTFFLSSILDNLATTIIMITLLRKLLPKGEPRMILVGIVIIAANAGGAWSPIGDVTTTLLWINGQVSALGIMQTLIIPSLACLLVPMLIASIRMRGKTKIHGQFSMADAIRDEKIRGSLRILLGGIGCLLLVPILKSSLGLPPFIGVLFGLGLLAVLSETIHWKKSEEDRRVYSVSHALSKVDVSSILYFMGILLLVYALEEVHILVDFAKFMDNTVGNKDLVVIAIGFLSSIVDNGSLVAATQGMYPLSQFPMDDKLWEFIAYCAGTGGSMLVIGSAAGVASMNMEGITFGWYFKKISILALCGYVSGIIIYLLQYEILHP